MWNFTKIGPLGAELFHADGRSDIKLIVAFRNFANPSKNEVHTNYIFLTVFPTQQLFQRARIKTHQRQRPFAPDSF
jgi:hypothetical protein